MHAFAIGSAFAFLLLGFSILLPGLANAQDNLLINGDFSNGTQGWDGDFDNASADDANPLAAPTASAGQLITLHNKSAVRIFQSFSSDTAQVLYLSVKFAYSPDAEGYGLGKLSDVVPGFDDSASEYSPLGSGPGAFAGATAFVVSSDTKMIQSYTMFDDAQNKSFDRAIKISVFPNTHYRLYLAFPPGRGSVTLTRVKLSATPPPSTLPPAPVVVPQTNASPQSNRPPPIQIVAPSSP